MNNSIGRLIEGMAETLRQEIIPKLDDEFARGQAFGIIYMLNTLKLRASWSIEGLSHQREELVGLFGRLEHLVSDLAHPGLPDLSTGSAFPTAASLEAVRDRGDQAVCDWLDWVSAQDGALPKGRLQSLRDELLGYVARQMRHEVKTSAKPMFAEMSRGSEDV
jgi:hypothetical protein